MTAAFKPHPTIPDALVDTDGGIRWRWTETRDGFVLGETMPTPDNTGVPAGTVLEDVTGDVTVSTDDTVYVGKRFHGKVTVRANLVRFYRCEFLGGTPSSDLKVQTCGLDANHGGTKVATLMSECTFVPTVKQVNITGIIGSNVTTHRCKIMDGWTDALNWQTTTTGTAPGSCHSLGDYLSPMGYPEDPTQPRFTGDTVGGPSHSDCIQIANGRGHTVFGSHLAAVVGDSYSHGMVWSPYAKGAIGGGSVIKSWFSGGGAQLSAWPNGTSDQAPVIPGLKIIGNRFDARGTLNDLSGGVYRPQSILLTPETFMAATIRDNLQTYPCTPASGTPFGASATPEKPTKAYVYVTKLNW